MMERLKYIINPKMPKVISVEDKRLNPLASISETKGAKINARRNAKARIIMISVRR
jgi:hypothetical protein